MNIFILECNEYQQFSGRPRYILPLPWNDKPLDVTSYDCSNVVQLIPAGVYDILKDNGHEVAIEGFLKHPKHRFTKVYHDIALVKLKYRVYFTSNIRPACLWDTDKRNTSMYIATGFGKNETLGKLSTQMMKVVLEEFPEEDCVKRFNLKSRFGRGITDGLLCVGSNTTVRDTCLGDSAGPLQTVTDPSTCTYHVIGVVSTGLKGCGIGKARAVYTMVSYYLDWIEENVWGPKANSMETYEKI
ncbi:hypothetical protein ZHAS_00005432 [Anopheles sinensis]|uniref:Peptidase S1 domain-containing protein n=1 Tax=Anopheles sinensis TaxID=74873 RepID=A0A084VJJ8_ANOSI|nr:hypothetical protein ZHAS_00005432 [Anopheles sinensis]